MPKIKCVVLIPLARNDGMPVGPVELRGILNRLLAEFGGYTVAGEVEGGWRSPTGLAHRERNTQVWVAVESRQVANCDGWCVKSDGNSARSRCTWK